VHRGAASPSEAGPAVGMGRDGCILGLCMELSPGVAGGFVSTILRRGVSERYYSIPASSQGGTA